MSLFPGLAMVFAVFLPFVLSPCCALSISYDLFSSCACVAVMTNAHVGSWKLMMYISLLNQMCIYYFVCIYFNIDVILCNLSNLLFARQIKTHQQMLNALYQMHV